jgi:hypothetical protein
MIADVSGSIGGAVFARNRGGSYARNRTTPLNPQSTAQSGVRSRFADLATAYSTELDDSERSLWTLYGANVPVPNSLGDPRFLTGLQHYIRSNSLLLGNGMTRVDVPPLSFNAGPSIELVTAINAAADTISVISLDGYVISATNDLGLSLYQGRPVNPGVNFYKAPFRQVYGAALATATPLPTAIPLAFGVAVGQANFVRSAYVLEDGRVGVPFIRRFLVA